MGLCTFLLAFLLHLLLAPLLLLRLPLLLLQQLPLLLLFLLLLVSMWACCVRACHCGNVSACPGRLGPSWSGEELRCAAALLRAGRLGRRRNACACWCHLQRRRQQLALRLGGPEWKVTSSHQKAYPRKVYT